MSLGSFHYCFRSKAELFAAILDSDLQASIAAAWRGVEPTASSGEGLRSALVAYWDTVERDPDGQLMLAELDAYCLRHDELHGIPAADYHSYRGRLSAELETFAASRQVRIAGGADALAEVVIALLSGVTSAWLATGDGAQARATLQLACDLLAAALEPLE